MQIIQKIRDKGAAIVIGVIALSLIGFILMDANLGLNRSGGGDRTAIGKVNGVKVTADELEAKVKAFEQQSGGRSGSAQANMFRQNAWDQIVYEKVAETEFEKLGISFSPKELTAIMFSDDAPYTLKQAFTNPDTKEYDLQKVQEWWTNAKKLKGEERDAIETQVVAPIRMQAMYAKYAGLIASSGYYPTWMKEKEAAEAKQFATIDYVSVPYSVIADSTIKVSDDDITAYMAKRKAKYEQDGGRLLSYVSFSTNPSGADTAAAFKTVQDLRAGFEADSTVQQSFVARNASAIPYSDVWVTKAQIDGAQKDTIAALPVNAVVGPYLDATGFVLAKKLKVRMLGDSVKCRHILLGTVNRETGAALLSDSVAKAKADSIELAIKGGASFDELEAKYSTDQAAHKDKGVMTFDIATVQNPTSFAPEFGEFLINDKGETRKVVKTNFGWHYIEILQVINPAPVYKVAYMAKPIDPSDETVAQSNNTASKLSAEAKNVKGFEEWLSKNKLQKIDAPKTIEENDYAVGALQDARNVVRWAYEAKEGQVSEPFDMKDQVVVAVLTKIVPKGLPAASTMRAQLEGLVRNSKKADAIKAKLTATPTLESAAAAYPGLAVATAGADSALVFTATIVNGIGAEPKVIGAAFNKAYQSKASEAIEGTAGVFVVKVKGYGTKTVDTPPVDKSKALAQQLSYGWFESLKKLADITDNRSKSY